MRPVNQFTGRFCWIDILKLENQLNNCEASCLCVSIPHPHQKALMNTLLKCISATLLCTVALPVFADDTQEAYCKMQSQLAETTLIGRYLGKSQTDAMQVVVRATDGMDDPFAQNIFIMLMGEIVDGVYARELLDAPEQHEAELLAEAKALGRTVHSNCMHMDVKQVLKTMREGYGPAVPPQD